MLKDKKIILIVGEVVLLGVIVLLIVNKIHSKIEPRKLSSKPIATLQSAKASPNITIPGPTIDLSNLQIYTNDRFDYSFQYPAGWEIETMPTETSKNSDVNSADHIRLYNIKTEQFEEGCRKSFHTGCSMENGDPGIMITTSENSEDLDADGYFVNDVAKDMTVYGKEGAWEVIKESKKETIANLTVISGDVTGPGGFSYYYFLSPSEKTAFRTELQLNSNNSQIMKEIFSSLKFAD
ncbi:MAG TPA: hypothetical protein VG965_04300 [Patescibacteria group bacterium]|nr:hypothetical protein [Patescibacteria group bacterium]